MSCRVEATTVRKEDIIKSIIDMLMADSVALTVTQLIALR